MEKLIANARAYAFNVWDIDSAKAIIDSSVEKNRLIFLQISSTTFDKIDFKEFNLVIREYITKVDAKVILHLDHSRNIEQIYMAIEAGWDSVMYDGSHFPIEENIFNTTQVVEFAKKRNVLVEGEIGRIQGEEDDFVFAHDDQVTIGDVIKFVSETGVDLLAIALGTSHGQYTSDPKINYDLIQQICDSSEIPIVVHGGSGLSNDILRKLWSFKNIMKINISTDIKLAFRLGLLNLISSESLYEKGFDALKVKSQIYRSLKDVVCSKFEVLEKSLYE